MASGAGNLEPQDCYSASALMQLGGREMGHSDPHNMHTDGGIADLNAATGTDQNALSDPANGGGIGIAWPLNIFGMQGS